MNYSKGNVLLVGIIIAALAIGGYFLFKENDDVAEEKSEATKEEARLNEEQIPEDTLMKDNTTVENDGKTTAPSGTYEIYNLGKLALAQEGSAVLFFHASWCSSCRGVESDINKNLSKIPAGVHILKIDYDTNTDLKQKYGVTYQHTFVQVDSEGNLIKKWSGAETLTEILTNIE